MLMIRVSQGKFFSSQQEYIHFGKTSVLITRNLAFIIFSLIYHFNPLIVNVCLQLYQAGSRFPFHMILDDDKCLLLLINLESRKNCLPERRKGALGLCDLVFCYDMKIIC